jgi:hypothetical protein
MCVFINSLINLEFIQLLKHIIILLSLFSQLKRPFQRENEKIIQNKINIIYNTKNIMCV